MSEIKFHSDKGAFRVLKNGTEKKIRGRTTYASDRMVDLVADDKKETATEVGQSANVEVGNFVSELMTAVRPREIDGLPDGDWIEEPERLYTDGLLFGEEVKETQEGRLQVTLTLDASMSMWRQYLMEIAAPTFRALHRMFRLAQAELPPGALAYAPFVFHEKAFVLPDALVDCYDQTTFIKKKDQYGSRSKTYFTPSASPSAIKFLQAAEAGQVFHEGRQVTTGWMGLDAASWTPEASVEKQRFLDAEKSYPLLAEETFVAPLFAAIEAWEAGNDPNATRLDIVITDGLFEKDDDVRRATEIQERRNGRLATVFLNFLDMSRWSDKPLPGRCIQYPIGREGDHSARRRGDAEEAREAAKEVRQENVTRLTNSIRGVLLDALSAM